jgi:hypothetical protein
MFKSISITVVIATLILYASSCYNNKKDVVSLPRVSFLGEVVPIITADGCGCHSNVNANSSNNNAFPFTRFDTVWDGTTILKVNRTVFYDGIIARVDTFRLWVNGTIGHPGGGIVDFTPGEKRIIKAWIDQGQPYDGGGSACVISPTINFHTDILTIYNTTCKSSGCHGGRGPVLDYPTLVANKNTLVTMMGSGGSTGHPGGVIGLSSCISAKFIAWINAGQPQ